MKKNNYKITFKVLDFCLNKPYDTQLLHIWLMEFHKNEQAIIRFSGVKEAPCDLVLYRHPSIKNAVKVHMFVNRVSIGYDFFHTEYNFSDKDLAIVLKKFYDYFKGIIKNIHKSITQSLSDKEATIIYQNALNIVVFEKYGENNIQDLKRYIYED